MKYLLIALALISVACSKKNQDQRPASEAGIVAFGDSFTYGEALTVPDSNYLDWVATSINVTFDNQSLIGSLISEAGQLGTIRDYPFRNGQLVIFLSGHTDSMNHFDPVSFKANMKEAMDIFDAAGVYAFVGGCIKNNPGYYTYALMGAQMAADLDAQCKELSDITQELAGQHTRVKFVDTYSLVHLTDGNTVSDPNRLNEYKQHPNEAGHQSISKVFLDAMIEGVDL